MRPNILLSCLPRNLFSANLEKEGRSQFCWDDFFLALVKQFWLAFFYVCHFLWIVNKFRRRKTALTCPRTLIAVDVIETDKDKDGFIKRYFISCVITYVITYMLYTYIYIKIIDKRKRYAIASQLWNMF